MSCKWERKMIFITSSLFLSVSIETLNASLSSRSSCTHDRKLHRIGNEAYSFKMSFWINVCDPLISLSFHGFVYIIIIYAISFLFDKVKPSNHAENQLVTFWSKKKKRKSGDRKGFTHQKNIFTEKRVSWIRRKTKLDLFFSVMFKLLRGNVSYVWITNLLCEYENNMAQKKQRRRYRPACLSFDSFSLSCLYTQDAKAESFFIGIPFLGIEQCACICVYMLACLPAWLLFACAQQNNKDTEHRHHHHHGKINAIARLYCCE